VKRLPCERIGEQSIYSDGSYLEQNPHWHEGDSAWKAAHIATMLQRNQLTPATVCEVGCGAGEILRSLSLRSLPGSVKFDGYDISSDAYAICAPKQTETIRFHLADLLEQDQHYDLALAIDVVEHVEDYYSFLRRLKPKARHKIFHIPLELSALMVARRSPLMHQRRTAGHLHHFSKETALACLEDTGYQVIDYFYTSGRTELGNLAWKTRLLKGPRKALGAVSPDAAARLLGGYSLLVLAE
jgi:cyclopropane fatty-acyl-phospholipid synthase-like methyltransferase